MVRKGHTPEQIINKLREAEVLLSHRCVKSRAFTPQEADTPRPLPSSSHPLPPWRLE